MTTPTPRVYRAVLKVAPKSWHSSFLAWDFGYMALWFYAMSEDDARQRALDMLPRLQVWELADSVVAIFEGPLDPSGPDENELRSIYETCEANARQAGFAIFVATNERGQAWHDALKRAWPEVPWDHSRN